MFMHCRIAAGLSDPAIGINAPEHVFVTGLEANAIVLGFATAGADRAQLLKQGIRTQRSLHGIIQLGG